ncbi:hypothetical protein [Rhizobiales bacterium]|uniref:hypothetical protein n=1 Tax=unclassified Ensifer TaxID=2633371 RepID=UPI0013B01A6C
MRPFSVAPLCKRRQFRGEILMATACYAEAVADGNPMIGRASSTEYLPPRGAQLRAPSVPLRNRYVQRTPRQGAIPRRWHWLAAGMAPFWGPHSIVIAWIDQSP